MAGLNPLPPHVVHSSKQLTHAQAHSMLSQFLEKADNDAAYRPDSTLTDRGPQSTSSGASPNLTLHHLKRILQGIEGKKVGGDNLDMMFGELAGANRGKNQRQQNVKLTPSKPSAIDGPQSARQKSAVRKSEDGTEIVKEAAAEGDGWQDKDDYELAQDEEEYDVAQDQAHPAGVEQPANEEEIQEEMEVHVDESRTYTKADKEARKRAKKERSKKERQEREKARTLK